MFRLISLFLGAIGRLLNRGQTLLLENLALRQQVPVLKRNNPSPKLARCDRCFWIAVSRSPVQMKNQVRSSDFSHVVAYPPFDGRGDG